MLEWNTCRGCLTVKPVAVLPQNMGKERFTAFQYVVKCQVKISRVPGVCDITGVRSEVQEQGYLVPGIFPKDSQHVSPIPLIHADDVIVLVVVGTLKLCGPMVQHRDSPRSVVDAAAYLFGTGGGGVDVEMVGKTFFVYEILHDELGHWAATDIAVADKKYRNHVCFSS